MTEVTVPEWICVGKFRSAELFPKRTLHASKLMYLHALNKNYAPLLCYGKQRDRQTSQEAIFNHRLFKLVNCDELAGLLAGLHTPFS